MKKSIIPSLVIITIAICTILMLIGFTMMSDEAASSHYMRGSQGKDLTDHQCDCYKNWLNRSILMNRSIVSWGGYGPNGLMYPIPPGASEEERLSIIIEEVFPHIDANALYEIWKGYHYSDDVNHECMVTLYKYWKVRFEQGDLKWSGGTIIDFYGYLAYWNSSSDCFGLEDPYDKESVLVSNMGEGEFILDFPNGKRILIQISNIGEGKFILDSSNGKQILIQVSDVEQ